MRVNRSGQGSRWRGYQAVLGQPRARRLMLWGFVARLREGGIGLALVLMARHATGSFAAAGAVSAAFYLSAAIMRPVQGRWMDRRGHRQVLSITAAANTVLLAAAAAIAGDVPAWLLIVVTASAGASMPATSSALRALWPTILAADVRDTAYALDSLLYELAIVIGPALVGVISTTGQPAWAVTAVAGTGLVGTLNVALVPGGHDRRQHNSTTAPHRGVLDARFRTLVAVAFLVGAAEGPLTVAITAAAVRDHVSAASGLLVSALATGSVLGMLLYGMRTWTSAPPTRLVGYTIALTAGLLVLTAATATTAAAAVALAAILVGLALGPTITTIALFVNIAAHPGRLAEAFAWTSFATPCGAAAAQALSGILVTGPGPAFGILAGAVGAALAAAFALLARRQSFRSVPVAIAADRY